MTISKYYRNSTLYPSLVVILATTIFSSVSTRDYNSEWLTTESIVMLSVVIAIAYSLLMSFLCLPILLVRIEVVKKDRFLTALSWFFLPFLCILIVLIYAINSRDTDSNGEEWIYLAILTLPFVAGLLWSYWGYKNNTRKKNR